MRALFNYRKQGGSYAQVCVGFQIPADCPHDFETFAADLKYEYVEETDNPAYHLFLK